MRDLIRLAPASERANLILSLPASLARRGTLSPATADLLAAVLVPFIEQGELMQAVRVATGRAWLESGQVDRAWAMAEQAHQTDPGSVPATLLFSTSVMLKSLISSLEA